MFHKVSKKLKSYLYIRIMYVCIPGLNSVSHAIRTTSYYTVSHSISLFHPPLLLAPGPTVEESESPQHPPVHWDPLQGRQDPCPHHRVCRRRNTQKDHQEHRETVPMVPQDIHHQRHCSWHGEWCVVFAIGGGGAYVWYVRISFSQNYLHGKGIIHRDLTSKNILLRKVLVHSLFSMLNCSCWKLEWTLFLK